MKSKDVLKFLNISRVSLSKYVKNGMRSNKLSHSDNAQLKLLN